MQSKEQSEQCRCKFSYFGACLRGTVGCMVKHPPTEVEQRDIARARAWLEAGGMGTPGDDNKLDPKARQVASFLAMIRKEEMRSKEGVASHRDVREGHEVLDAMAGIRSSEARTCSVCGVTESHDAKLADDGVCLYAHQCKARQVACRNCGGDLNYPGEGLCMSCWTSHMSRAGKRSNEATGGRPPEYIDRESALLSAARVINTFDCSRHMGPPQGRAPGCNMCLAFEKLEAAAEAYASVPIPAATRLDKARAVQVQTEHVKWVEAFADETLRWLKTYGVAYHEDLQQALAGSILGWLGRGDLAARPTDKAMPNALKAYDLKDTASWLEEIGSDTGIGEHVTLEQKKAAEVLLVFLKAMM